MHDGTKWLLSAGLVALLAAWPSESRAQDFLDSNSLFAVVRANGTLLRGVGAVSSQHLATGEYEVIFSQDVRGCGYFATQGLGGSGPAIPEPGQIGTARRSGIDEGVFVVTRNAFAGDLTDRGFHLIVDCDNGLELVTTQSLWAVVKANGSLGRSNGVQSSSNLNTGQYEVVFNRNVSECVYTGTIGVPGDGFPANRLIKVADRGNPAAVFVQTRETDGTAVNQAFHVQVDCP
jgi:hypothetical protein